MVTSTTYDSLTSRMWWWVCLLRVKQSKTPLVLSLIYNQVIPDIRRVIMYYISKTNELGLSQYDMCYYLARMVKRLSDFSHAQPEEGSEWVVRKRRKISTFDALPVY